MAAPTPRNGYDRRANARESVVRHFPHNHNLEQAVLGGIILRNEVLAQLEDLDVDHFFDLRHKVVFQAIRTLASAGRPIDIVTLEAEIESCGRLDAVGGIAYLAECAARVPTVDNVVAYAAEVKCLWRNRAALIALASAMERAQTWPHDPFDLVAEVAGELQRIEVDHGIAARATRTRWAVPLLDYLGDGEPDEDDSEDWILRDVIPRGEPALWGGPMKGGKTWAAIDLCISVALGHDWLKFSNTMRAPARVLGLFLEDNKRRLRKRLWELTRARMITPNDATIREHLRISRAPLRLPDAKDQRRFAAEVKAWGAVLVVIDNLTRVMVGDPNSTREAAAFTKAWTELGDETGATILFLHHTKKPNGDAKQVDPFELLRGSGDFGATARNIIVSTPIRTENTEKLSEVRMRGNLDLRRESFTLAFERKENVLGKWQAKLVDRGEIDDVKDEVSKERKANRDEKKKQEHAAELERRRTTALDIARREGCVSGARLANAFGMSSARTFAPVLVGLVQSGVLRDAGKRGYELTDSDRQEPLL